MSKRRPAGFVLWGAAALLLAAAWSGWLATVHLAGERSLVDRIEEPLVDLRLVVAGPLPPPAEIIIVGIDDATVASAGGYPLPRDRLAMLVRNIQAAGARALAIDLLLVDATTPQDDAALAEALATIPTVLAAAGRFERGAATGSVPATADELWPLPVLTAAASVGFANVSTDAAGTPRHLPLVFETSRGPIAGFALQAVGLYEGTDPILGREAVTTARFRVPLDIGWNLPMRIHGPTGSIATISAADVLAGDGAALAGRLAVLGVTATAVGDTFSTPFDPVTPASRSWRTASRTFWMAPASCGTAGFAGPTLRPRWSSPSAVSDWCPCCRSPRGSLPRLAPCSYGSRPPSCCSIKVSG
ncbi:MAG TPA: CHASE2 domain-containing protein [Aurantimonas sp.]|jgi:adenylate cyclase|nr:CHASE2 domain-containing protein [Aurantimonas sp.]